MYLFHQPGWPPAILAEVKLCFSLAKRRVFCFFKRKLTEPEYSSICGNLRFRRTLVKNRPASSVSGLFAVYEKDGGRLNGAVNFAKRFFALSC
jgi:hypothetical protein